MRRLFGMFYEHWAVQCWNFSPQTDRELQKKKLWRNLTSYWAALRASTFSKEIELVLCENRLHNQLLLSACMLSRHFNAGQNLFLVYSMFKAGPNFLFFLNFIIYYFGGGDPKIILNSMTLTKNSVTLKFQTKDKTNNMHKLLLLYIFFYFPLNSQDWCKLMMWDFVSSSIPKGITASCNNMTMWRSFFKWCFSELHFSTSYILKGKEEKKHYYRIKKRK